MGMPGSGSSRRGLNGGQRLHGDFKKGLCQSPNDPNPRLKNSESRLSSFAIGPLSKKRVVGTTRKRRTYTWTKEAREMVQVHSIDGGGRQKLITALAQMTGYPRPVCIRFASHMGAVGDRSYKEWSEQEVADLKRLHTTKSPRQLAAILNRPESSVRAMLRRLGISVHPAAEDRFTKYELATLLHVRPQVVQDWIDRLGLKAHREGTERLPRVIIKAEDFIVFCKRHHAVVLGRRVNQARLEFFEKYVLPDLMKARKQKRRVVGRQPKAPSGQSRSHDPMPAEIRSLVDPIKPAGIKATRTRAAHAS